MIPMALPKVAPAAIEGTKIPAGTLQPYVTIVKMDLPKVAIIKERKSVVLPDSALHNACSESEEQSLKRVCMTSVMSNFKNWLK